MAMTIHVDIVSAEKEIFSGVAEMVFAPGIMGELGIAPKHSPLLTYLAPGEVRLKLPGGAEESFYVSGGILEIQPHVVTVLSDTAMRAEDLDEAAVLKAKEEADRALHDHAAEMDFAKVLAEQAEVAAQLLTLQRLRKRTGR
ncbi:MAG: F0F1 ATP synthase subunit epsilon [Gammaproteobacteria bacterium RIFCSPLOWO2_02_FULL_56_15]|nr:MAG: F0F1 ATP synthase subunit epsilon [Gammaproteobacteria bacterium RIFCSPLOWO2_02_FULL_56_15]